MGKIKQNTLYHFTDFEKVIEIERTGEIEHFNSTESGEVVIFEGVSDRGGKVRLRGFYNLYKPKK